MDSSEEDVVESKERPSCREMDRLFLDLCFLEVRLETNDATESFIAQRRKVDRRRR